ncbi:hypothetical protein IQ06DRAFT_97839 [Phaeosphaeriaceae sp. SRC1lsM3a]|nr:hypothetical protein IQ06DRAFT_97839 [Stagonospora sp. SRC1lsM3a]
MTRPRRSYFSLRLCKPTCCLLCTRIGDRITHPVGWIIKKLAHVCRHTQCNFTNICASITYTRLTPHAARVPLSVWRNVTFAC